MTDTDRDALNDVDEAGLVFVDPKAYADDARFHAACALLRREDPIHLVEHPLYPPFYAITKHADVHEIEMQSKLFHNTQLSVLAQKEAIEAAQASGLALRTLVHMDDPDHRAYRGLTADWFKPRSLAQLDDRLAALAREAVDKMASMGGSCDFARDIAVHYPLQVILTILGLPASDFDRMLRLTQELFGNDDPEVARSVNREDLLLVLQDFFGYFSVLTEDRRACPADDLASVIANSEIDGCPIGPVELVSYYMIIATAGHDTTSSAMAGGVQALVENPDQLDLLRSDMSLLDSAADEIIRWTTPVKHFMRTATEPYSLRGHEFSPGDLLLLSYPSANRDEAVFENPFVFDITRTPNPHLAFGFGAHYCLGARLAKMEIKALLSELIPRLKSIQLAGPPALVQSTFVSGLKRLPLTYELT